jgi:xanthine dehydrogenase accessory factor
MLDDALAAIDAWSRAGRDVALATVVSVSGSTPRGPGAKLAISDSSELAGSVSGGCVEGAVVEEALATLREGRPRLLHYGISDEMALDVGLMCGGEIDVFIEPLRGEAARLLKRLVDLVRDELPAARVIDLEKGTRMVLTAEETWGDGDARTARPVLESGVPAAPAGRAGPFIDVIAPAPRAWIVGAGHIAEHLVAMLPRAGFRPVVVDPRRLFAEQSRFGEAEVVAAWPDAALREARAGDAVVVLSHDPKIDEPALLTALRSQVAYVGAIGSRSAQADRAARLREAGLEDEELGRLHAPIGLDLGGREPGEIALAIAAELVATRRGGTGGRLSAR